MLCPLENYKIFSVWVYLTFISYILFRLKRWGKVKEKEKDRDLATTIIIVLLALCFVVLDAGHVQFTTGCVKTKMKVKQYWMCKDKDEGETAQ